MRIYLLLLLIFLSGCSPLAIATPRPSPQIITVAYTATLRPWVEILQQCAIDHPEVALIVLETSRSDPAYLQKDIALWFGNPPEEFLGFAASLGVDEIRIIAGEQVKLQNPSQAQLQEIYGDSLSRYHIWTYGEENELRQIFDELILGASSFSPESVLTPNPETMLQAIRDDPLAIGYLPQSWLTKDDHSLNLDRNLRASLIQPVLALTEMQPQGLLQSYLVCVQNHAP